MIDWEPVRGVIQVTINQQGKANTSSAIVVTVDGLNPVNTALSTVNPVWNWLVDPSSWRNYLADNLQNIPKTLIFPFEWDTSATDTVSVVPELADLLKKLYRLNSNGESAGKLIVVSHSWGTVLSYLALTRIQNEGIPFKCDLFITLSSPLGSMMGDCMGILDPTVPGAPLNEEINVDFVVATYTDAQMLLSGYFGNPDGENLDTVTECYNFWALGDVISGPIVMDRGLFMNLKLAPTTINDQADDNWFSTCNSTLRVLRTPATHLYTGLEPDGEYNAGPLASGVKRLIQDTIKEKSK